VCRVICYSPRHDLTLARMTVAQIRRVVDAWAELTVDLGARPGIRCVQVFENRGAMMGASNPHPHGQAWASSSLTNELRRELVAQREHHQAHGRCLLCDYAALELRERRRVVCANDHFVALVPFWAVWPFETLVLGRRHAGSLADLPHAERDALADVLGRLTAGYDALFGVPFPYTMGIHQRPTDGDPHPAHHLHAHFYPPLLRSATVRKFMVGYELLGTPQRDITAEVAAERLRSACAGR
jgi:UDPglucose--hexose-1-phosphate uridylyltransferase